MQQSNTNINQISANNNSNMLVLNKGDNPKIFQFNQAYGRISPMIKHEINNQRKISEEEESQVLFQSKILNTFERSPRDLKIILAFPQD